MEVISRKMVEPYSFYAIDSHTMGEPTRVITKGFPNPEGVNSIMEKKNIFEKEFDIFRKALILEPRGHSDMFGAVIDKPINPKADLGVVFMESAGYLNMCVHGSIGVATVAVETGLVELTEPITDIILDTPVGLVKTEVLVEGNKAKEVSLTNVPSFVVKENYEVEVEGIGKVPVDIAFGGNFFALVNEADLNMKICMDKMEDLIDIGMEIKEKLNEQLDIEHPELDIKSVDLVEFYGESNNPEASLRNVVVFGNRQVDRSPCGTGTSAKLASLYKKGKIDIGELFVYESITGSLFKGEVVATTKVGDYEAVIPKITGSAYITGRNELIIDPDDPLKFGFSLR